MPAFRLFPRKTLRRKASQNDITIHVSAASDHSHLAAIPPRRRRLTLRLPHWGSEKKQDKVSSSPSPDVDLELCDPSPSKTLLSVLGADPECKELTLDTSAFTEGSLLLANSEGLQPAASCASNSQLQRSATCSVKPLPSLPEPVVPSLPRHSSSIPVDSPVTANHIMQRLGRQPSWSSSQPKHETGAEDDPKRSAYLKPGSTVGDKWNTFTIEYLVNAGTFGLVYCAHSEAGERVAIKVMAKDWLAVNVATLEGAKLEFEVLRRASEEGRKFMTQLLSSWADQHNIYFVMRFYPLSLRGLIATVDKSMLPFWLYAAELISAVNELHQMGFIHLDIKPENILVSPNGHVSLADFGLAYRVTPENPLCPNPCGTYCYEAPEVITKNLFGMQGCDQRADIWSIGLVILQMFVHDLRAPHEQKDDVGASDQLLRIVSTDPRTLWEMRYIETHVPDLHSLLCRMLERDPRLRIDVTGIMAHPYFRGIDWEKLAEVPSVVKLQTPKDQDLTNQAKLSESKYQPKRQDSKPIDYDFNYRCPPELRALGDVRHGAL